MLFALMFAIVATVTHAESDLKTVASKAYVDTQIETKQLKIPAAGQPNVGAGETVMTYTATGNGQIGERALYSDISSYDATTDGDKLITASALNATFTNLPTTPTTKLECANESDGCTLWTIVDQTAYARGLPDGYTRLEYIQSTGTQYIDTGYVYTDNSTAHVVIDTTFTNLPDSGWKMHGVSGSAFGGPNVGVNTLNKLGGAASGDFYTDVPASINIRYLFDLDVQNIFFSVTDVATGTVLVTKNNFGNTFRDIIRPSYVLFGYKSSGDAVIKNSSKIYSAQLYDGGVLVGDFIPARRNSDSVLGMYDTVSGTFKENAGTGTFTAGPDM